jgi:hypothetical protein
MKFGIITSRQVPVPLLKFATADAAATLPGASSFDASINEAYLWHAPDPTVMHTVMHVGFDERYAGASVGTAFGHARLVFRRRFW